MTTLIERLEEVEAGSRELDAEIFTTFDDVDAWENEAQLGTYESPKYDAVAMRPPTYTTRPYDLTAAMGLVPEGWRIIRVEFSASGHRTYMHLGKIGTLDTVLGIGSSMSLALTAAALRAKEIEDEQG